MIVLCGWCNVQLSAPTKEDPPSSERVSHGICGSCAEWEFGPEIFNAYLAKQANA